MTKIFISYRRADTQHAVDRMYEIMKGYVEDPSADIFIDVDGIPPGVDFVEHIEGRVARCQILLAVIGNGWADARDPAGKRRLEDPNDYVRIEIASALKRDIPVVPVFLDGVSPPDANSLPDDLRPLRRRNGESISRLSFDADVERIMTRLGFAQRLAPNSAQQPAAQQPAAQQAATAAPVPTGTEVGTLKVISNVNGPARGQTFFVKEGDRLKIGRNPKNDLVFTDLVISRRHCGVTARQGRLYVEDYQASNGTKLNGRTLASGETAELRTGDHRQIGDYILGVQIFERG